MVLKRDIGTPNCILYVRGCVVEEAENAVRFDRDIGTWGLLGAADEIGRTDKLQAILEVLRGKANPLTEREVSDILGKNYDAVRKTLSRMWNNGEIEKKGRGTYTCPNCPNVPTSPETDNVTLGTGGMSSMARNGASAADRWPQYDDPDYLLSGWGSRSEMGMQ